MTSFYTNFNYDGPILVIENMGNGAEYATLKAGHTAFSISETDFNELSKEENPAGTRFWDNISYSSVYCYLAKKLALTRAEVGMLYLVVNSVDNYITTHNQASSYLDYFYPEEEEDGSTQLSDWAKFIHPGVDAVFGRCLPAQDVEAAIQYSCGPDPFNQLGETLDTVGLMSYEKYLVKALIAAPPTMTTVEAQLTLPKKSEEDKIWEITKGFCK